LPLLGGGSRAGDRLQGKEGEVSPYPSLLRARGPAAAIPHHTQTANPNRNPEPKPHPPEEPAVPSAHACLALGSPLRGFAEQRFPLASTGPHVDRRSLNPLQKAQPSRKRNPSRRPSFHALDKPRRSLAGVGRSMPLRAMRKDGPLRDPEHPAKPVRNKRHVSQRRVRKTLHIV